MGSVTLEVGEFASALLLESLGSAGDASLGGREQEVEPSATMRAIQHVARNFGMAPSA